MNAIWVLMGLLLLSYIGSLLVGGRAARGGLASGAEYVVLGFVIGPTALGLIQRSMLEAFQPVASVALGWLAFVFGLTHGVAGGRSIRAGRLVGGWTISLVSAAAVGGVAWLVLAWLAPVDGIDRVLVAGGIGAACAETTRYAVRWVVLRYAASGPLSELVGDLSESADEVVPLLAVAALFALRPAIERPAAVPVLAWAAITLGLGATLGAMGALLLGKTLRQGETWGVLLGTSMLAIGMSWRLGLATIASLFAMGAALSALSPHRAQLCTMVVRTERPVLLPALVLAGAHVHFGGGRHVPWLVAGAIATRVLVKWVVGLVLVSALPRARPAGRLLGLGLTSAGALAMSIGLAFAIRFPGPIGDAVLATAAVATVVGEILGPASLRAALKRAGEIGEGPPRSIDAAARGETGAGA